MKKIIAFVLLALGGIFVTGFLIAVFVPPPVRQVKRFPHIFRANFISGCVEEGASPEYCLCALEYLEANYSLEEVLLVEAEMKDKYDTPAILKDAMLDCLDYL